MVQELYPFKIYIFTCIFTNTHCNVNIRHERVLPLPPSLGVNTLRIIAQYQMTYTIFRPGFIILLCFCNIDITHLRDLFFS